MEDFRMLVLTRKLGEKILIGDDITITVVDIGKSRLKLGIEAPAGHHILRSELVGEPEQPTTHCDAGAGVIRTEIAPRPHSPNRWGVKTAEAVGA
jgi:carbon storage regulator CsrA